MPLRSLAGYDYDTLKHKRRSLVQQLRRSLDAEALLTDLLGATNVSEKGNELVHSCLLPFGLHRHGDASASASLNRESLLFNCFLCGGGDIFWLVSEVLDVDIPEAIRLVSGALVPSEFTAQEFRAEIDEIFAQPDYASLSLPSYSDTIVERWQRSPFWYFDDRGVTEAVQTEMRTGVDLEHRELYDRGGMNEWFVRPRVVIPMFFEGKLRGWQKRKMDDEKFGAKYTNPRGFPRAYLLYGWDRLRSLDNVVLVESPMSYLALRSAGFNNVVASLGSEVTPHQQAYLRRCETVTLFLDADVAGEHATEVLMDELGNHTELRVVDYGGAWDVDPADEVARAKDLVEAARSQEAWLLARSMRGLKTN